MNLLADIKSMKKITLAIIALLFVSRLLAADTMPTKVFQNPDRIRYDGSCMTIE